MRDPDNRTVFRNLTELNAGLRKLDPEITGIDLSMLQVRGANNTLLNIAIEQDATTLYNGIKRNDVLNALRPALRNLVNTHPAQYRYDPHGEKHFPGGPSGTKFSAGKDVVNPLLVGFIAPEIGRIRRDANGRNQTYYLTHQPIPQSQEKIKARINNRDITIQIDFDFSSDTITYHGYPDEEVKKYVLSRMKDGEAIPQ